MVQGKWFPQGADLSEVISVRRGVFSRGEDPLDAESWNVLVYQDGVPAASGRLWWREGSFWLGDLGVLPAYRGQKLGIWSSVSCSSRPRIILPGRSGCGRPRKRRASSPASA